MKDVKKEPDLRILRAFRDSHSHTMIFTIWRSRDLGEGEVTFI